MFVCFKGSLKMNLIIVAAILNIFEYTFAQEKGYAYEEPLLYDKFPEGFEWGAATAAYQVNNFLSGVFIKLSLQIPSL